jgi:group I intron endonuclease
MQHKYKCPTRLEPFGLGTDKERKSMPYIYLIRLKGKPKYVGFTSKSLKQRLKQHISASTNKSSFILHRAIKKYGSKNFTIEMLMEHKNKNFLLTKMEPKFIKKYNTHIDFGEGYNMTMGGEGNLGMSQITKNKISQKLMGIKRKPMSEKTKQKLSKINKGKKLSPQTIEKMKKSFKKAMTKERKNYLSKINSGLNHPQYGKNKSKTTKLKISNSLKKYYSSLDGNQDKSF